MLNIMLNMLFGLVFAADIETKLNKYKTKHANVSSKIVVEGKGSSHAVYL